MRRSFRNKPFARWAYKENRLRRELAKHFDDARKAKGLSVRRLAAEMKTTVPQVKRLLHEEAGGTLKLSTLCRAADILGVTIWVRLPGSR